MLTTADPGHAGQEGAADADRAHQVDVEGSGPTLIVEVLEGATCATCHCSNAQYRTPAQARRDFSLVLGQAA
jgi:hypothetical protein